MQRNSMFEAQQGGNKSGKGACPGGGEAGGRSRGAPGQARPLREDLLSLDFKPKRVKIWLVI